VHDLELSFTLASTTAGDASSHNFTWGYIHWKNSAHYFNLRFVYMIKIVINDSFNFNNASKI